jgi:hypothetical protein
MSVLHPVTNVSPENLDWINSLNSKLSFDK